MGQRLVSFPLVAQCTSSSGKLQKSGRMQKRPGLLQKNQFPLFCDLSAQRWWEKHGFFFFLFQGPFEILGIKSGTIGNSVKEEDALEILRSCLAFLDPCTITRLTGKALAQPFNVLSILLAVVE